MSNAIYPTEVRGLTYTVFRQMQFDTIVQSAPNKSETRLAQTINPIWAWELPYDYLKNNVGDIIPGQIYTDLKIMQGFYAARGGEYDDFLFPDPDDFYVGPGLISAAPNTLAELQLITDGLGHYYSPLQRHYGGSSGTDVVGGFYEDITDLQPGGGA